MLTVLTLCLLTLLTNSQNVFQVPDVYPCVGEEIEMSCIIEPPTNETFFLFTPYISFNNSLPYSSSQINSNVIPGVDTSRFEISLLWPESPRRGAQITIKSYQPQDGYTVFGCHGNYFNGTNTAALASGTAPQVAAVPNQIYFVHATIESISSFSCLAGVDIDFLEPYSQRSIEKYELYADGTFERYLSNDSGQFQFNKPPTYVNLIPGEVYSLRVAAVSCAGTALLSQYDAEISLPKYTLGTYLLSYLDSSNDVPVFWSLSAGNTTTEIGYSLQVLTSFIDGETTNIIHQKQEFSQPSTDTSFQFQLGLTSLGERELTLNITVNLEIISQCGVTESGSIATDTDTGVTSTIQPFFIPLPLPLTTEVAILSILTVGCGIGNVALGIALVAVCCVMCSSNRKDRKDRKDSKYVANAQQLVYSTSFRAEVPLGKTNMGVQSEEVHYANVMH